MSLPTKNAPCPKVITITFLGVEARGVVLDEGSDRAPYLFLDDFVSGVTVAANDSPFSPWLRNKLNSMARPVRVDDGGKVIYAECLSENAALDILMQLPNEIGGRVRAKMLEAYHQLRRFYDNPMEAVGHFSETAVDAGHDPDAIARKARYHARRKNMCNGVKGILEKSGKYQADKKFTGWAFAFATAAPIKAATGMLPSEIKAATGVKAGIDGLGPVGQDLSTLATTIYDEALRLNEEAIVNNIKAGAAAGKLTFQRVADVSLKPIESTREQLKAIGLMRSA